MKITGNRSNIFFDVENGYVLKAEGEMLVNRKFVVDKSSMTQWESPHEDEPVMTAQVERIIKEVSSMVNGNTVIVEFE